MDNTGRLTNIKKGNIDRMAKKQQNRQRHKTNNQIATHTDSNTDIQTAI